MPRRSTPSACTVSRPCTRRWGGSASSGPSLRPIQDGARIAGSAVTVLSLARRQPHDPRGDRAVPARRHPRRHDGLAFARRLVRRAVRDALCSTAGCAGSSRPAACATSSTCARWASRCGRARVNAQGTVKATAGSVNVPIIARRRRRPSRRRRSSPMTTVCCACRGPRRRRALAASDARVAKEAASRAAYQRGELSLDRNNLRPVLADLGVRYLTAGGVRRRMHPAATDGIRCMLMRGGTSKGAYFLAEDLPADLGERDDLLLRVMGSPDPTQIDGLGGAHPLTSKVAIVSRSSEPGIDVDYLFLQVVVDQPVVSRRADLRQPARRRRTVRDRARADRAPAASTRRCASALVNTGDVATHDLPHARRPRRLRRRRRDRRRARYRRARIELEMSPAATRRCCRPGNVVDEIAGHRVTLIDNGMPVVLLRADEFGVDGRREPRRPRGARRAHRARSSAIRARRGPADGTRRRRRRRPCRRCSCCPRPAHGGAIATRAFIPHAGAHLDRSADGGIRRGGHPHSRARSAPISRDSPADGPSRSSSTRRGAFPVAGRVDAQRGRRLDARPRTSVRTARKIFDGTVFPRPRL